MESRTFPPRSLFGKMPIDELLKSASMFNSQKEFLEHYGIKKRGCLGLSRRLRAENIAVSSLWPDAYSYESRFPSKKHILDLENEVHAYFYGLALADGHLRESDRNRGYLAIELMDSDASVLRDLSRRLPWKSSVSTRSRKTNFSEKSSSVCMRICDRELRRQLVELGFPVGKKSHIVGAPSGRYSRRDFWRGFIDGDGSIGNTLTGLPFISVVTKSSVLAQQYKDFVFDMTGKMLGTGLNSRDKVYNLMITGKAAGVLASALYGNCSIAITRKERGILCII